MSRQMRSVPHVAGFTLSADGFIGEDETVGFFIADQLPTVFSHFHDFYELALVLHGVGRHVTEVGTQRIERGSAIFVAPGVSHGYEMGEGLVVYNCFLRAETARYDLSWAHQDPRLSRLFQADARGLRLPIVVTLDATGFDECVGHLDAMRSRVTADRGEAFDMGHLLLTLDILARQAALEHLVPINAGPEAPGVVRDAVGLIMRDLQVHWTLDALASELSVGPHHLIRLFDRWAGSPPMAFANARRADRAAILLASTDDPIPSSVLRWAGPTQPISPGASARPWASTRGRIEQTAGHVTDRRAVGLSPKRRPKASGSERRRR